MPLDLRSVGQESAPMFVRNRCNAGRWISLFIEGMNMDHAESDKNPMISSIIILVAGIAPQIVISFA